MRAKKGGSIRVVLFLVGISLFVSIIGKLAVTLMGAYGGALFITLDSISSSLLLIWLFTLILYVSPIQDQKNQDT
jgi:hypothetical protein